MFGPGKCQSKIGGLVYPTILKEKAETTKCDKCESGLQKAKELEEVKV